ncbi:MAG TPA: hypothetical protein VKJ01_07170, partial [Candidatus Solibacter sp.]|nr:hypothetical protein [Candidatus Solibacter sp.]
MRALRNRLAPAACPAERKPALARTFRICAWVTLLGGVPPGIAVALLGDHRRALIIVFQELCLLAA